MKLSSLNKGLVLHQTLDKESLQSATVFADKTPYENIGTSTNVPVFTTDRMGQANRAMSFNGTTNFIDCGNDASLQFGANQDFSVSFWMKIDANLFNSVITKGSFGMSGIGWSVWEAAGKQNFKMGNGVTTKTAHTDAITLNTWNHIVFTVDRDGYLKAYLNSDCNAQTDISSFSSINYSGYNFIVGANNNGISYHFNGSLADVRIYNRVITQQEITALYEAYRPKISMGSLQKGLVLDMPLNSTYTKSVSAGTEIMTDRTPYSNDGQNTGGDVDTDHTTFIVTNSDHIRIPDSASLSPTSAMSTMIWIKAASQDNYLFSHYDSGGQQRAFAFRCFLGDKISIFISADGEAVSGNFKNYQSSIVAIDSTWHLVGFSFDAGALKLYVDGMKDTNPTKIVDDAITIIHNSSADVMIGCLLSYDIPKNFFTGDLAKAKIWNRALTDAEWLLAYEKQKEMFL